MVTKVGKFEFQRDRQRIEAAIEMELHRIGEAIRTDAVLWLRNKGVFMDGNLIKNIEVIVNKELFGFTMMVNAFAAHAVYVHEGTKPHWAPIAPLKYWASKKVKGTEKERNALAYAVQASIAKRGTKPKPFLAVAFRAHQNKIQARVNAAIEEALRAS